jgi:CubicO group peptidase (beta-lactamase class C family)
MELRPGTPEDAGMDPERVERLRKLCASWVPKNHQAIVVAVARRGVLFLHEAWGRLRPGPDASVVTTDAIFPLASITKPFTATCAMILVEDGLLEVNRQVKYYIPEFRGDNKAAVCVRHLLTHTSGLDDFAIFGHIEAQKRTRRIPDPEPTEHPLVSRFLHSIYDAPLAYPVGQKHLYCNFNYELVGEVVRRVSGKSLADFARERIFAPLGLKSTDYVLPPELRPRVVKRPPDASGGDAFPLLFGQHMNSEDWLTTPWGCGGVCGTARELGVFGQMFLNGGAYGDARILSRSAVDLMRRNHTPGIRGEISGILSDEVSVGYGWFPQEATKVPIINSCLAASASYSHLGYGVSVLFVDPANEMVAAFLAVSVEWQPPGLTALDLPDWRGDLFLNALTAAVP